MVSREMVLMNRLQGRSGDAGVGDGLVDMGDGGGMNGESSIGAHAVSCETPAAEGCLQHWEPRPGLWDDREGWGGLRREGIYI